MSKDKENICHWNNQQSDKLPSILHEEDQKKDHEKFKQAVNKLQASVDQGKLVILDGAIFPPNWNMYLWGENHQMALARPMYCRHVIFQ